jgi:protein-disulfide isomerase
MFSRTILLAGLRILNFGKEPMPRVLAFLCALLFLPAVVAGQQKTKADSAPVPTLGARPPSEETVNSFMQQMFGHDPSVSWKVVEIRPASVEGLTEIIVTVSNPQGKQNNRLYVMPDGKHALVGDVIPFGAHPFTEDREKLEKGINGFAEGPANAPVTIFEFSDLQCPFCKQAQPKIDRLMAEEKDARLIFQSFPLASHNWATKGAYYADCVGRLSNEAFWKFIHSAFDAQQEITPENADEKLTAVAEQAGVKGKQVAQCAGEAETAGRVQHSIALGMSVEVNGTPTLFINGRKISNIGSTDSDGVPYSVLKGLVEFAAKQGK